LKLFGGEYDFSGIILGGDRRLKMKEITREEWMAKLRPGDIGLILSNNLFSTVQNWLRMKDKNSLRASHGFIIENPPGIIEANGAHVSRSTIGKNVGDTTQCWIFRYPNATREQINLMLAYADGMVDAHGEYSVLGIVQFAMEFFGIRKKFKDEPGVYCTELTGKAILKAGLPYSQEPAYLITPSDQRSWFVDRGLAQGVQLPIWYDGKKFYCQD
jgi:hypothetical protein